MSPKARIYKSDLNRRGWHWFIEVDGKKILSGWTETRWGAEFEAKRAWKKFKNPRKFEDGYYIELGD